MFRLKEEQLHILMWLVAIASILLFGIFGVDPITKPDEKGSWKGMEDFSNGWICTYETTDDEKLQAYRKNTDTQSEEGNHTIVEVLTFPMTLSVKKDTAITMLHQVPDMNLDTAYLTMELDNASVRFMVDQEVIYESNEQETMLPVRHIVPIAAEHKGKMMTIEVMGYNKEEVEIGSIRVGNYNQLWITAFKENGLSIGIGLLLICLSFCMLVVQMLADNIWRQKRLLIYSGIEGVLLGVLCLLESNVISLMTGWNYGVFILKSCITIMAVMLHLTIVRCFVYKKKILTIVDTGIAAMGVFFISTIVLQAFSLMHFDTIYLLAKILFGVMVITVTIILAITIFDYKTKEDMPVFLANIILILSIMIQGILHLAGKGNGGNYLCINIGVLIYMICIWVYGVRQLCYIPPKKEDIQLDEEQIRKQVVEQLNPNLIFASFQTLQNLIKSGSAMSVKMIYYISVYLRHNLKALEMTEEVIPFEEELEHIIAYLQLQKTRNRKLDFTVECKVKEFQIPRHSLEPLVENAVKHGIANNDNSGNVAVRTYTRADGYAVQIIDDGAGFDWEQIRKQHTSLSRTLKMLEHTCQAHTEVISKEGKGTVITIVLPMLENDLMDETEITEG